MFEVTSYNYPLILVMSRRTGETYRFLVGEDGALVSEGTPFDDGDARKTAKSYLVRRRMREQLRTLLSA
jgi:hypothetical protein